MDTLLYPMLLGHCDKGVQPGSMEPACHASARRRAAPGRRKNHAVLANNLAPKGLVMGVCETTKLKSKNRAEIKVCDFSQLRSMVYDLF